jgi:hypothetical protein
MTSGLNTRSSLQMQEDTLSCKSGCRLAKLGQKLASLWFGAQIVRICFRLLIIGNLNDGGIFSPLL